MQAPKHSNVVLSFDVGKRNFAYCQVYCKEGECFIKSWNNINLRGETTEQCTAACIALLTETTRLLPDNHNTYILIERQLPQNIPCMCLSHAVFAFFLTKFSNINVSFVNAQDKPLVSNGTARKVEAVKMIRQYLDTTPQNVYFKTWYEAQNKKDDIADCLLQVLGNLDKFEYKPQAIPIIVIDE